MFTDHISRLFCSEKETGVYVIVVIGQNNLKQVKVRYVKIKFGLLKTTSVFKFIHYRKSFFSENVVRIFKPLPVP